VNKIGSKAYAYLPVLIAALIALDQFTKYLSDVYLSPVGTSAVFIEGILSFTSAHNTGAAFSVLYGSGAFWVLAALRAAIACAIAVCMVKWRRRIPLLFGILLSFILAGALGNLMDQALLGYVRDMFEFTFVRFAIFNMADVYITVATAILFAWLLFCKEGRVFLETSAPPKTKP